MSGQWEGKVIQPLWETASLLQLNMWVLGTQDLTARCVPKKAHVGAEDVYKNLYNMTSHKSLALETFQMLADSRIDNELCHVYTTEHCPAVRKHELLGHKKVKVKSPSLWVDWVWLPFPSPGDDIKQI